MNKAKSLLMLSMMSGLLGMNTDMPLNPMQSAKSKNHKADKQLKAKRKQSRRKGNK